MASEQKYLVSDLGPNAEQLLKGPRPTSGSVLLHHLPSEESPSGAPVTPVIHVVLPDPAHRSKLPEGSNTRAKLARFPPFCGHFHQGMDQNRCQMGVQCLCGQTSRSHPRISCRCGAESQKRVGVVPTIRQRTLQVVQGDPQAAVPGQARQKLNCRN